MSQLSATSSIAVLDDDPDLLAVMEKWLADAGYAVEAFSSSPALADVLNVQRFDLLLLDYHLPKMNGVELLKSVRLEKTNTKCVMISAGADGAAKAEATRAGASAFLTKPIDRNSLLQTINQYLSAD